MTTVLYANASIDIGSGHVVRSLTIAEHLRERGRRCAFVTRALDGHAADSIRSAGFDVALIPELPETNGPRSIEDARSVAQAMGDGIESLVADSHDVDEVWTRTMRPYVEKLAVVDDVGDRRYDCDVLINADWLEPEEIAAYERRVPGARLFLGPQFTPLRSELLRMRSFAGVRNGRLGRIAVYFGGSDEERFTFAMLEIAAAFECIRFDVVVGSTNADRARIEARASNLPNVRVHLQGGGFAALLAAADLAVGAAGVSMYERAYLGLPAIAVGLNALQRRTARRYDAAGLAFSIDAADDVPLVTGSCIAMLEGNPELLSAMSGACLEFSAGHDRRRAEAIDALL